jgi:two-component sensor histidine kinase
MDNNFSPDLWQLWNNEIKASCENSNTLLIAVISIHGELLLANPAMNMYFFDTPQKSLINPDFDSLVKIVKDESVIFSGFLTIGKIDSSKNISLQAKVYRRDSQLLIIGEVDVNQLIFVNDRLFELNNEVNDLQRKLLKEKAQLTKALEELRESQKVIIQSEIKIKVMLSEKEILLKEVHHRIKNNMNTIKSLLFLQADSLENPSAVAALNDAESRVESMMVLYDKLYRSDGFRELSVNEYLPSLIDEILSNFPNKMIVKVEKHIDDFILDSDS